MFINPREALASLLNQNEALKELEIIISSRALKSDEAIGHPEREDFPLLRGKEVLLQAEVPGGRGQAFTADPIAYKGPISDLLTLSDDRPGSQALLVASLNALFNKLGLAGHTVHCVDHEPEACAEHISQYILEKYGLCNIGIIGYQPAILEHCTRLFGPDRVSITDLDADVVGTVRYGVKVMDGLSDTRTLVDFADVLLVTGTILANGTYRDVLGEAGDKPCYFFGTTCAALARLNNMSRLCPFSR
ncbi:MAG: hypothetical protein GX602_05970 [Dehalococcoidales bacterium]|jgi:hypothetical protein|nr:hypothetical protein [Dehalococcoidales bacterium]